MKKRLLSSLLAMGAVSMFGACSEDTPTPFTPIAVSSSSHVWSDGSSSSVDGANNPGSSSSVAPGSSESNSSSSVNVPPGSSSSVNPSLSSSSVDPTSSATPNSSAAESSSSAAPQLDASGFPTLESYGPPPAEYTKDILSNGNKGWNSRYWDACKPHCSWISNGQEGKTDTTTQASYRSCLRLNTPRSS